MFSEKKIPRKVKDQLKPLVQKLLNICTNVKVLTRQAEWDEIQKIFELLKSVQDIEEKFLMPRIDRRECWQNFYDWCSKNGAEFDSVTVKEVDASDYGVFAERDIKESDQILLIPRKIMMSEITAQNSKLGPLISSDPILHNMPNVQLAMHLLMESLDPNSFWLPYISILPSHYNTIHYFNYQDFKELQGSPVLDEVFNIFRSVVRQYCYFFFLFQKDSYGKSLNIGPYFTYDLYRWAVSTIMTRQNIVPSADEQLYIALIPFFDMCNHVNGKLYTDFNLEKDSLISYSFQACPKGNEVFIFYGPRTNAEFFVHNGFVYPENENDAVELKMGISKNDPLHSLKSSLCEKLNISVNGPFYIGANGEIPEDLLSFLKINVMKSEELEKCILQDDKESGAFLVENSDLIKRAYSFLKDRLFLLLKSYKTTVEEDEELLKNGVPESKNHHLTILLRLSEKRIISISFEKCVEKLKDF